MKQIPLTQGLVALIDDEDYERISKLKWYANGCKYTGYRATSSHVYLMSRFIMFAKSGELVDHINHNTVSKVKKKGR